MANTQQDCLFEFLVLAVVSFAHISGSASLEAERLVETLHQEREERRVQESRHEFILFEQTELCDKKMIAAIQEKDVEIQDLKADREERLQRVEHEFSCLQAELAHLHTIMKDKNALERAEIQKLSEKLKELNTKAEQQEREVESLRRQLAEKEREHSNLKKSTEEVCKNLENAQQRLISLDCEYKVLNAKKDEEISVLKRSLDEACRKIEKNNQVLHGEAERFRGEIKSLQIELGEKANENAGLKTSLNQVNSERESRSFEIEQLKNEKKLESQILIDTISQLKGEILLLRSEKEKPKSDDLLLSDQKERGECRMAEPESESEILLEKTKNESNCKGDDDTHPLEMLDEKMNEHCVEQDECRNQTDEYHSHDSEIESLENEEEALITEWKIENPVSDDIKNKELEKIELDKRQEAEAECAKIREKEERERMKRQEAIRAEKEAAERLAREAETKRQRLEEEQLRREKRESDIMRKGRIRAFCRIRPFRRNEGGHALVEQDLDSPETCLHFKDEKNCKYSEYHFDHIFGETSTQEQVYEEVSQLVESALDGNRACVMAYGQTGSGKSFTMIGSADQKGLIPRAAEQIFAEAAGTRASLGWKFRVKISAYQIYNNAIQDMLDSPSANNKSAKSKSMPIVTSPENSKHYVINGLTRKEVFDPRDILKEFNLASKNRVTQSTKMNHVSSRSHFVFEIDLLGENEHSNEMTRGGLVLVDLAGSEAFDAGNSAVQMKEGQQIRDSLTALKTFLASAAKKEQADFRTQKLAHVMKMHLQKNGKLLVIANISPANNAAGQTKDSLDFIQNICHLKTKKKQTEEKPVSNFAKWKASNNRNK
jgi:kinesin family protein C1